jgi:hypothetical protein
MELKKMKLHESLKVLSEQEKKNICGGILQTELECIGVRDEGPCIRGRESGICVKYPNGAKYCKVI